MAAGTGRVTIYALCDPDTLAIRYVGKALDLAVRIRCHRWEAKSSKLYNRKVNWLRSLKGRDPVIIVLEDVDHSDWQGRERYWIAEMKRRGCKLTNFANGGQTSPVEGKGHSAETKAKLRQMAIERGCRPPSRKGSITTAETRAKLCEAVRRRGAKPPSMGGWNKGIRKTHCKNGHEYTPKNTRICVRRNRSHQVCRQCEARNMRDFYQRKKEVAIAGR